MSGSLFKQVLRNIKKNLIGLGREGGIEEVTGASLKAIKGKLRVYILEMFPLPEYICRHLSLLLRGEKLIIIQAGSRAKGGHESELEG